MRESYDRERHVRQLKDSLADPIEKARRKREEWGRIRQMLERARRQNRIRPQTQEM